MSGEIVYDTAAFELPAGDYVFAALKGSTNSYIRGTLVRRWTSLVVGSIEAVREFACELAAEIEDGHLEYKPKPTITAEEVLATVERKLAKAALLGQPFASANAPRIAGFCLRVERDAIAQWQASSPGEAARYLSLKPQLRSPYGLLVLEKQFPATVTGLAEWRCCRTDASYVQSIVAIHGGGEF